MDSRWFLCSINNNSINRYTVRKPITTNSRSTAQYSWSSYLSIWWSDITFNWIYATGNCWRFRKTSRWRLYRNINDWKKRYWSSIWKTVKRNKWGNNFYCWWKWKYKEYSCYAGKTGWTGYHINDWCWFTKRFI